MKYTKEDLKEGMCWKRNATDNYIVIREVIGNRVKLGLYYRSTSGVRINTWRVERLLDVVNNHSKLSMLPININHWFNSYIY